VKRGNIVDQSAGRFPGARHIAAQAVRGSGAHLGKIRSALLRSIQPALTLLEPIGNIPPAEAEERYYAQLKETALAA